MKILFLSNKKYYLNKMDRVRFHNIKAIGKLIDVTWWGIGWEGYNNDLTLEENINKLEPNFDLIIAYKPLEMKDFKSVNIPKCLIYNEMWKRWTDDEIIQSGADLVICHHKNEMKYHQDQCGNKVKFMHIPHSAEKTIFKDYKLPKTIDLLLVGDTNKLYVLRKRFKKLLNKRALKSKYKCVINLHPGYQFNDASSERHLIEYAQAINSAKITLADSTIHKVRLAKYVEIPMCASALAADLPDQDQEEFKQFIIEIDNKMKDKEIINKLIYYLEHDDERQKLIDKGLEWANNYTQEKYAERFLNVIKAFLENYHKRI